MTILLSRRWNLCIFFKDEKKKLKLNKKQMKKKKHKKNIFSNIIRLNSIISKKILNSK